MSNYYCLVAGLPGLLLDDQKLAYSVAAFYEEVYPQLSQKDKKLFNLFFYQYDNKNLLCYLKDRECTIDPRGTLSLEELEQVVKACKEDGEAQQVPLPCYNQFIPAYLAEKPLFGDMLWEDQLATLYYAHGMKSGNSFVSDWFELNLNINNLLIALMGRRLGFDTAPYIVGDNSVAKALRSSTARDFGLGATLPYFDAIQRIAEEGSLYERERKIDQLKWNWLEENTFFHYFSFEAIFAYLLQLEMIERWQKLNPEAGKAEFQKVLTRLREDIVVPEEFKQ